MKLYLKVAAAVVLLLGIGGVVKAQMHGGRHGGGEFSHMERGGGHGKHGMRMIDTNGDGVIGDDEAAALADMAYMHMDADRDGNVTEVEFVAGPRKHKRWFGAGSEDTAAIEKTRKERFVTLDLDKNAKLTKTEFFADAKAKLVAADADKDGKVTPWEFRAGVDVKG
jgi:hypothetical protein